MENLEASLQKQPPKWLFAKPQKWHTCVYLGAALILTILAAEEFRVGITPTEKYLAGSLFASLAAPCYFRAAQFINHFYGGQK